ncbi:alginate O-acetyltransferase AlgX-related protein (plasmid) [Roseobacteraceae bacterium NS-SX3]
MSISSFLLPAGIAASIAGLGLSSFAPDILALDGRNVLTGQYQRQAEAAFADGIPLLDQAVPVYTAFTLAAFGQAGPEVVVAQRDWLFTAEEFRPATAGFDFAAELAAARQHLGKLGIRLIPLVVPDKARIYADLLPAPRGPELETRYERTLARLAEQGLPAVDLRGVLQDGRAGGPTYMRTDTHWSPRGARLAADAAAAAAGLMPPAEPQFLTVMRPPQPFQGDLLPFVPAGPFAKWTGPAPEMIAVPETSGAEAAGGLFDDADIGLALVGTSFSARQEFNFAGFLQQATGHDLVSFAVEGQGPFQPMRDLIEAGALSLVQPQAVIWEIPERYVP